MKKRRLQRTISKSEIIKALQTEPLQPGVFVEYVYVADTCNISTDPSCNVCAVGAVLRRAGYTNDAIIKAGRELSNAGFVCQGNVAQINEELKNRQYLNALSVKFETLMAERDRVTKAVRQQLCKWVEKNLPNRIKL